MGNVFLKRGAVYTPTEGNFSASPILDDGIYQVCQDPDRGFLFLTRIADEFHFGFKLYGIDEKLVRHVLDTYNKQTNKKNLGVLLNGAKGTGKTVTAKVLANALGLPIILCDKPYPGLANFLANIPHDCVFLFDEFEKNFRIRCDDDDEDACAGESLLSIMDGVYNADHCHVFLLTTNKLKVNDNLLSRPSRIRYLKSFGEVIDRKILEEFVDDNLIYKEYRDEIMEFIDTLTLATIDIVKSIVEEVNIHNCSVSEFKQFFNVKEATYNYFCRSWSFSCLDDNYRKTKEEFLKVSKAPYNSSMTWRPSFNSLSLNKNIKKLKIGDYISSRYKVKEIDLASSYILCEDVRERNYLTHYYIENMDATPSLYNDRVDYAYSHNDDWW